MTFHNILINYNICTLILHLSNEDMNYSAQVQTAQGSQFATTIISELSVLETFNFIPDME